MIGINFEYVNLDHTAEIMVIRTSHGNPAVVVDTAYTEELNEDNKYRHFVEFDEPENYNYIVVADGGTYRDTITYYNYEVKGSNCNTRVNKVSYFHNGEHKTDGKLEIE